MSEEISTACIVIIVARPATAIYFTALARAADYTCSSGAPISATTVVECDGYGTLGSCRKVRVSYGLPALLFRQTNPVDVKPT